MKPRNVTLTGPEVAQLRRAALSLDHQIKDVRVGAAPDVVARRLGEIAETIRYLLDRAEERREVH